MKGLTIRRAFDGIKSARVFDDGTAHSKAALFFNRDVLPVCAFPARRAGSKEKEP